MRIDARGTADKAHWRKQTILIRYDGQIFISYNKRFCYTPDKPKMPLKTPFASDII